MWALLTIIFITSNVNELCASKVGTKSDNREVEVSKDGIKGIIPAASAFSVKGDNNPTATSFTDELQYPGIRGSKDMTSNGLQNIQPTLKMLEDLGFLSTNASGLSNPKLRSTLAAYYEQNSTSPHSDNNATLPSNTNTSYHRSKEKNSEPMCSNLQKWGKLYSEQHGYVSLTVCIFGIVANLLNILVLTRKEMNQSPINKILAGMALADILLDIEYVPFILYMSFPHLIDIEERWEKNSWGWSAYMIFHAHFSVIIHNVSIWLTLSVAIWRFIMIRFHHLVPVYCTIRRCHILLFSAYVIPIFLTIPNFLALTIVSRQYQPTFEETLQTTMSQILKCPNQNGTHIICDTESDETSNNMNSYLSGSPTPTFTTAVDNFTKQQFNYTLELRSTIESTIESVMDQNYTLYSVYWSNMALSHNRILFRINIWTYSFLLKLVPSIILTVITGFLIKALYKAEERSARLKKGVAAESSQRHTRQSGNRLTAPERSTIRRASENHPSTNGETLNAMHRVGSTYKPVNKRKQSTDRTTRLLIVILVLFLLTEFPQAILGMLAAFDPKKFFQHCYLPLGDVMDIMAIGNSTINFIVYYFMSKQFRKTFLEMCGFNRCCPHACQRRRSSIANANNNDVSSYNEGKWKWLDAMCIRFTFLWMCCRNRYDHDNNIIEIPELRADQKKVQIASPTQDHPNNDRMKRYQPRNGSCSEDQICEATPLVKNDKKCNDREVFTENEPPQTLTTYITKGTKLSPTHSIDQEVQCSQNDLSGNDSNVKQQQEEKRPHVREISNGDMALSGNIFLISEGETPAHKTCTTVLSSDGIPKSSISSQTEAVILNRQQSLRDQLSKSPGTAV